jgi:hypothetical protein
VSPGRRYRKRSRTVGASLDLPDDCWCDPAYGSPPSVGDVYDGVPLARLEDDFTVLSIEDLEIVSIPARFRIALVVGVFLTSVVVVPITRREDVLTEDMHEFVAVLEKARYARDYLRLPRLRRAWDGDALGLLYQPAAIQAAVLTQGPVLRLGAMRAEGRTVLRRRLGHTWRGA